MTKAAESGPAPGPAGRETLPAAWASLALALVALDVCYRHGFLLLYGDAVAHLHIARRILDSRNPGFRQLGSVWLPLPHLLLLPFVQNRDWWRTGLAGVWVSIPSYVLGCVGIYRLARMWLPISGALVSWAIFALNPGLLYMATTAMTEPLFLAEMVWAALFLARCARALRDGEDARAAFPWEAGPAKLLTGAGLVLTAAVFTRYDGWIYAAAAWLLATAALTIRGRFKAPVGGAWLLVTALLLSAPATWLAYNAKQFGDPLDFMRGPDSAKAIEARTTPPGASPHPGYHSPRVAALYFLKAAELGAAPPRFANLVLWLAIAGALTACFLFRRNQIWPLLLLWTPLPFYAYSIAYGSVPLFIPIWRPFSWYNTRYGMEMLPAFALCVGCLTAALGSLRPKLQLWTAGVFLSLIVLNSLVLLRAGPLVFEEAVANSRTRLPFEHALANALRALPGRGPILMYTSRNVGAVQQAGIPLRRIVNEGDYLQWRQALEDPAGAAPTVIACDGDAVDRAIRRHPQGLRLVDVICSTGQPCVRIFRSRRFDAPAVQGAPAAGR